MLEKAPPKAIQEKNKKVLKQEVNLGIRIGQQVREIRKLRGLSLQALAELSRLNINTLSLIENERTSSSVGTLQQLARSLQVPLSPSFSRRSTEVKNWCIKKKNSARISYLNKAKEQVHQSDCPDINL